MQMCEHGRVLIGSTCDQCHAEKARKRTMAEKVKLKFGKYMRECPFDGIDVYRVLTIFEVKDPAIQHAVKKLLCAGKRGAKDMATDIRETIVALERWEEMRREEVDLACNCFRQDDKPHDINCNMLRMRAPTFSKCVNCGVEKFNHGPGGTGCSEFKE